MLTFGFCTEVAEADNLRDRVLRKAAVENGFAPAATTHIPQPEELVAVGKLLFESRLLSFAEDTACASCHVDQFGSADGLPNAIGTEGEGIGRARIENGGDIIPRNTLPFWGRGGVGFSTFFWDGKIEVVDGQVVSQFGEMTPSKDPLVVAVHLPPAEIGEMVIDRRVAEPLQTESVESARELYALLTERVVHDSQIGPKLVNARRTPEADISFLDIAEAIASFIRDNFKVRSTKFHNFVFHGGSLNEDERRGGLLFYGRAGCSSCHSGAYFSDFEFHPIPLPQVGFGKNGFGVDLGRFNVSLADEDRYAFRTPPLYNVSKTAPYGHSGSVRHLREVVRAHFDPLATIEPGKMTAAERTEFYQQLRAWSSSHLDSVSLSEADIEDLIAFLSSLSYESASPVRVVD